MPGALGDASPQSESSIGKAAPTLIRNNSLAYAEMSMVMASLFSPWSPVLKLEETDASDVDPVCAFLLPLPRLDSKGVRVTVL